VVFLIALKVKMCVLFQPFRPFIITKDMLQKEVYGLGYPGISTMTVQEFFDKKVEEGTLHDHS